MKAKIINKQQTLIKEAHGHLNTDYLSNNTAFSESSNSFENESLVKLRIRCIPKEKDIQCQKHFEETIIKLSQKLTTTNHKEDITQKSDRIYHEQDHFEHPPANAKSKQHMSKYLTKDRDLTVRCNHNTGLEEQIKPVVSISNKYPTNEAASSDHMIGSQSKNATSEPVGNICTQSALSARSSVNSTHKSC